MKRVFTWFWHIDCKLWGDEVESNRYVSSLLLMFAFISGVLVMGFPQSAGAVPFLTDMNIVSVTALMVYVAGVFVCESFCVAKDLAVALLRSLLLIVLLAALYGGGCMLGRIFSLLLS